VTSRMQATPQVVVATAPSPDPTAHLIINDELPTFQGSGGNEYLCTLNLQRTAQSPVGVVSMCHRRAAEAGIAGLREAGVRFFLWESPHIDAEPVGTDAGTRRSALRRVHARLYGWYLALTNRGRRPLDAVRFGGSLRNMAPGLVDALSLGRWPVVSVIQTHAADVLDYLPRPQVSVLVMHDIRALVFERQAALSRSPLDRWRLLREAARYRRFEREACQRYDLVVTMSDDDAAWVAAHYAPKRVTVRRLPVDAGFFAQLDPREEVDGRLIFTGLMNHPPNVDAARFMAEEVVPRLRERRPDVELWIVGRHPSDEVRALEAIPGVRVTGEVPDVRPYLASAAVVVVPLRFGSGARNKIVEAWSLGKCVVSTSLGAEGLAYESGRNLLIADGAPALVSTIHEALERPALRDSVRSAGRSVVLTEHDPATIARRYAHDIAEVAAARAADPQPMRVAIDVRWMLPGMAGGIEQVARAFLREVFAIDRYNAYTLIAPARVGHGFDLRRHPKMRWIAPDGPAAYAQRAWQAVRRRVLSAVRFDNWESPEVLKLRWAAALDAELVYAFPGYTHPDVHVLPQVLMVPDIQHEYCPQFFDAQVLEERTRLYRDSIGRATHLCAISEFTRRTLIERLAVPADKVTTIPLAADGLFHAAADPAADHEVLRRHGLSAGGYLFFPGHTWRHKNHRTAIRTLAVLRRRHGVRLPLVCTGGAREAQDAIGAQIAEAGLEDAVRFLGYAPRTDLPALYRHAGCLIFPSLFEGFGMPVLEAMASGCPVVCSNTTSLPEIAGDAALLVDPLDEEQIADAIARLLRDRELRETLIARGRQQAGRYSWRRHTIDTVRTLHNVRQQLARVRS
jgi:glycosyltransferase involved in cell wall biosynthesis